MTNPELNAYLDQLLGVDQSQKMCYADDVLESCLEGACGGDRCDHLENGRLWATCPYRKPYTPPDYCNGWAAFGALVEWCHDNGLGVSLHDYRDCYSINLFPSTGGVINQTDKDVRLALARAVYEATKGT